VAIALHVWALASGGTAVITQVVLGLSVLTFRPGSRERWIPFLKQVALENAPVMLMYTPVHLVCTIWVLSFTFFPAVYAISLWSTLLSLYYWYSNRGNPKQTGCREWPWFRQFISRYIDKSLERWFGRAEVIMSSGKKLDPQGKYIYGYHPHGMYPVGAGLLQTLPKFRKDVCEYAPTGLCATALFIPPVLRDILCWFGTREVSRKTFVKTLEEKRSVLICPGGQEELVEGYRSLRDPKEIVLCSRHKGFCRIAIEQQASLVPVLSLGEIFTLQNALNIPFLQKLTYRWIGFPIPYLLVGRWLLTPLPRKVPLMYIVGEPIPPPNIRPSDSNFEEELNKLHQKFFGSLVDLFHKHKHDHPFYTNARVVIQ